MGSNLTGQARVGTVHPDPELNRTMPIIVTNCRSLHYPEQPDRFFSLCTYGLRGTLISTSRDQPETYHQLNRAATPEKHPEVRIMEAVLNRHNLGFHASIKGGIDRVPSRIRELQCPTGQIFTASNRSWSIRPFREGEVEAFRDNCQELDGPVVAHASYLINLAKPDREKRDQALDSLAEQMKRCHALGIPDLVLHPGSHVSSGEEAGLETIVRSFDELFERIPEVDTRLCPEIMAGQGTVLPHTLDQLAYMREESAHPERISFCLDTCHMHAAGIDITSPETYERTMKQVDEILGSSNVTVLHLNDSRGELDCRTDRHKDIGEGTMGTEPFRLLLEDERWENCPKILETPVDESWQEDYGRNLNTLVNLVS